MKEVPLARWDRQCLADLLALLETTPGSANFRSQLGDPNPHGTAYGGQLLAQTLMAASKSVPGGRSATAMQLFFAQGAIPDQAIYYQTSPLQDGKRFTSRHVRGTQAGGRVVLDAQLSFAVPIESIAHGVSVEPVAALEENPEHLPGFMNLPLAWRDDLQASLSFDFENPALDCRLPDVKERFQLNSSEPRLRFWLKTRQALGDDPHLHACAFAYMSDWWVNYPCMGGQLKKLTSEKGQIYAASLNHSLWLHHALRADEWLHFDCRSPVAANGRALCVAHVHDRVGRLVASVTQECLVAPM